MKKLIILITVIAFLGCNSSTGPNNSTLSGTYSLTDFHFYDNADCTGETFLDATPEELAQFDYTYEFDGNSVTIIQVIDGNEFFHQTCNYVIANDIFTPNCYLFPHTISSNQTEFYWEYKISDFVVGDETETVSACYKYIYTQQ